MPLQHSTLAPRAHALKKTRRQSLNDNQRFLSKERLAVNSGLSHGLDAAPLHPGTGPLPAGAFLVCDDQRRQHLLARVVHVHDAVVGSPA
jgi:hypothetical protein